jgi:hypothetical protein
MPDHDPSKTPSFPPVLAKRPEPLWTPSKCPKVRIGEYREMLSLALAKLHEYHKRIEALELRVRELHAELREARELLMGGQ